MDFLFEIFDNFFSCGQKKTFLIDENDKDLNDYFSLIEDSLKTCTISKSKKTK